jgi:hypothetical protein
MRDLQMTVIFCLGVIVPAMVIAALLVSLH